MFLFYVRLAVHVSEKYKIGTGMLVKMSNKRYSDSRTERWGIGV